MTKQLVEDRPEKAKPLLGADQQPGTIHDHGGVGSGAQLHIRSGGGAAIMGRRSAERPTSDNGEALQTDPPPNVTLRSPGRQQRWLQHADISVHRHLGEFEHDSQWTHRHGKPEQPQQQQRVASSERS